MNKGIIGAGNIGGNLTRRFRELGTELIQQTELQVFGHGRLRNIVGE